MTEGFITERSSDNNIQFEEGGTGRSDQENEEGKEEQDLEEDNDDDLESGDLVKSVMEENDEDHYEAQLINEEMSIKLRKL